MCGCVHIRVHVCVFAHIGRFEDDLWSYPQVPSFPQPLVPSPPARISSYTLGCPVPCFVEWTGLELAMLFLPLPLSWLEAGTLSPGSERVLPLFSVAVSFWSWRYREGREQGREGRCVGRSGWDRSKMVASWCFCLFRSSPLLTPASTAASSLV